MLVALTDALYAALAATLTQLVSVLGPAAACAVVLHQLERMTSGLLVRTFGWRAVLWTGWIGTPVHELSHVAACLVFSHEIEEVKLFAPDPETGTLGVVRHHAPPGNPWAAVGRFFIGVAPLLGGAAALYLAARLLLPSDALAIDAGALRAADMDAASSARLAFGRAWHAGAALLAPANLGSWRFWVFLYVATCIGSHLAPSRDDLRGAARGGLAVLATLFLVNLVAHAFGGIDAREVERLGASTTPVVALLVLGVLLCAVVLALVLVLCAIVERLRGDGGGHLGRFARDHWLRLAWAAAGALAFAAAAGLVSLPL